MSLPLTKKNKLSLVKAAQDANVSVRDLEHAIIGVGWDISKTNMDMDIDIMAVAHLDQSNKQVEKPKRLLGALFANKTEECEENSLCYFGRKRILSGSIYLDKDNRTGEDSTERINGRCDDERIYINFKDLPINCDRISIGLCIYANRSKHQDFSSVNNLFLRMHVKDKELFIAEISKQAIAPTASALHYVTFEKDSSGIWSAELIENYYNVASIVELQDKMK